MTGRPGLLEGAAQALRDHGLTAALTALIGGSLALAAAVTRKACLMDFPSPAGSP